MAPPPKFTPDQRADALRRLRESADARGGVPQMSEVQRATGVSRRTLTDWWRLHERRTLAPDETPKSGPRPAAERKAPAPKARKADLHVLPTPAPAPREPAPPPLAKPAPRTVDPASMTALEYRLYRYTEIAGDMEECRRLAIFGPLPALHKQLDSAYDHIALALAEQSRATGRSQDEVLANLRTNVGRVPHAVLDLFVGEARRRGMV